MRVPVIQVSNTRTIHVPNEVVVVKNSMTNDVEPQPIPGTSHYVIPGKTYCDIVKIVTSIPVIPKITENHLVVH